MLKKRAQQRLLRTAFSQRLADRSAQMPDILGYKVGQIGILGPVPHLFDGIKFRSIGRKPFKGKSLSESPLQSLAGTAMNHPAIPDQDNPFGKMLPQSRNKRRCIIGLNIMVKHVKIKAHSSANRRDGKGRDNRKPIPAIPTVVNGGLSSWCPRTADHRLKHKAAFIHKNDGFTAFSRVFLYAASRFSAMLQWPLRRVREPGVPASDNSNPSEQGDARPRRNRTQCQSAFLLRRPPAITSTADWYIHGFRGLATRVFPTAPIGRRLVWQDGRCGAWASWRRGHDADRRFSIDKPLPELLQNGTPLLSRTILVPATRWPPAGVAPFLNGIVSASYETLPAKSSCLSEFFKGQ